MHQKFCVCLVGLSFAVSVTFLLLKDPRKDRKQTLKPRNLVKASPAPPVKHFPHQTKEAKEQPCFKDKFADILLVIIYNHPLYDSANLLREFYQPAFPNVYLCGEVANATYDIRSSYINKGIYGYKCLADSIEANPGFKGYLYINDDVIVNYWNLAKFGFNFSHVGESSNQFGKVDTEEEVPKNWYWWISPYGFKNCKKSIHEIEVLSSHSPFYKNALNTFNSNGQNRNFCYNGRSDIVYIPQRVARAFHEVSNIFYKHHVFLEIAIPTILRYLTSVDQISTLHGMYLPGDVRKKDPRVTDSRYFWTTYLRKATLWFIHPFKLHHYEDHNRDLNIELMKRIMIRKTGELTNCKAPGS